MNSPRIKRALRLLLAGAMTLIGVMHFVRPSPFVQIVPRWLPAPLLLVYVSGFFEVLGGVGLLDPRSRSAAGWGLVALYVCVFPANLNMAMNHIAVDGQVISPELAWGRLPVQALLIAWAWWVSRPDVTSAR